MELFHGTGISLMQQQSYEWKEVIEVSKYPFLVILVLLSQMFLCPLLMIMCDLQLSFLANFFCCHFFSGQLNMVKKKFSFILYSLF